MILAVPFALRALGSLFGLASSPSDNVPYGQDSLRTKAMYSGLAVASCVLHWVFLLRAVSSALEHIEPTSSVSVSDLGLQIARGGFSNLCQSSITFDAIFSSVLCACFMVATDPARGLAFSVVAAFTGPAAAFAAFAAELAIL